MTTEGDWPWCLPNQWGVGTCASPATAVHSLEAVGLGCPRELVTQEIGARAPLAMGAPRGRPR